MIASCVQIGRALAGGSVLRSAHIIQEPMTGVPDYAAIAIDVEQIDDHRQPAFQVEAGADRRWVDESEREALGQRIRALPELAAS